MKTLLQINVTANFGSTGKIAEQIGAIAQSQGWRSVIAYGRRKGRSTSELYRIGNNMGIGWHLVQSRLLDRHGRASRSATRNLIQYIEKVSPDVIHLHNIHGYYLNYEMLFEYLGKAGIPVVWTLHDCWTFTGHCAHFDFISCDKWKTECSHCPQLRTYPSSILKDRSRENFRLKKRLFNSVEKMCLVPVSDWLAGFLSDSFLKSVPRKTIHNGIDVETFRPYGNMAQVREKYGIGERRIILGVANVWTERKGFQDFLTLRERLSDDYAVVLVGLSKKQVESLPEGIVGIERTESAAQLAALYSAADVFFNPTYEDNFPTVNLESMACGTPVVTYDTGGCAEAVDSTRGAVVPQGDLDGALEQIMKIVGEGKEVYARTCRDCVVSHFTKEEKYKEYLELYNEIIR